MLRCWLACGLAAMSLAVAGAARASEAGEKPASTVTLSVERASLASVLKKIEAQTYYTFFFNNELVGKAAPVTLSVKQVPVPDVLAKIFAGSDLTYEFREDKILIKRRNADKSAAQAQEAGTASDVGGQAAGADRPVSPPRQQGSASPAAPALVQGVVRDDAGQPVAGVSVIVKGSLVGAVTESDGSYRIKARPNDQLSFSFLGFKTQDVYVGSKTTIDVALVSTAQAIDDVVVTALGMKREEKSLGYAATKVKGDVFSSSASSSNWMSGLSGQVAGLSVAKANTGGGGSMRVTLRGESSIDLNNNGALFVIDGVPMFNTSAAGGESGAYSIDYGNGTGDVNPEDIENITVLKGPAATALYGSEAANGAIIITTKSGEGQDGSVSVTFTSNFVVDQINSSPDFQYVYGQGSSKGTDGFHYGDPVDGEGTSTLDVSSWGPKMDGTLYYQYFDVNRGIGVDENGALIKTPFVSYGNWFKNFFQNGWTATNTLSVSGKINKNNSIRFSVTDYRSESKNQIVSMPVSQASGVASRYSNTGRIRNWGWEVSVNGTLVKTKKVQWKAYANWALNRNRVLELGELIHRQTFDWTGAFLHGDHLSRPYSLHCVDLGQGFKEPAVYWQQSGDSRHLAAVGRAVEKMRHTIGLPTGLWAGDEKLRFGDPTLGSELCTAVEMMFSLEQILQITGGREWGDYLERVAYNALPTQTTDAQDARQYYQQVNQVEVTRKVRPFSTPHEDTDIVFGLCTGYPCCTSNLHQGWPKLVQNLWYATRDGGLAALVYAPSTVETTAGGMKVAIEERTDYPFRERIAFRVTLPGAGKRATAAFPLHLRIPGWCAEPGITLNGEKVAFRNVGEGIVVVERAWRSGDCLNVTFPACVAVRRWYDEAAVVERGPLVYALRMDEKWERREMEPGKQALYGPYYYEVTSDSPWNFCLPKANVRPEAVAESFVVEDDGEMAPYPWTLDGSPVKIRTRAIRLGDWTLYSGSAGPIAFVSSQRMYMSPEEEWIELIPYGCTTLRITEFPVR